MFYGTNQTLTVNAPVDWAYRRKKSSNNEKISLTSSTVSDKANEATGGSGFGRSTCHSTTKRKHLPWAFAISLRVANIRLLKLYVITALAQTPQQHQSGDNRQDEKLGCGSPTLSELADARCKWYLASVLRHTGSPMPRAPEGSLVLFTS